MYPNSENQAWRKFTKLLHLLKPSLGSPKQSRAGPRNSMGVLRGQGRHSCGAEGAKGGAALQVCLRQGHQGGV